MVETRSKARQRQEEERINCKEYNVFGKINNINLEIKKDKKKEITNSNNSEINQDVLKNDNKKINKMFNYDDYQPFLVNQYEKLELKYHSVCNIM